MNTQTAGQVEDNKRKQRMQYRIVKKRTAKQTEKQNTLKQQNITEIKGKQQNISNLFKMQEKQYNKNEEKKRTTKQRKQRQ